MKRLIVKFLLSLSYIIPKNKKIWIFGAWFGEKYADNPKAMFEYVSSKKNVKAYWITNNKEIYRQLKKNAIKCYMKFSFIGILKQIRAKYVFICTGYNDVNQYFISNSYIIDFFHGVPLKHIGFDDEITKGGSSAIDNLSKIQYKHKFYRKHFYISTSEAVTKTFKTAFRANDNQIIEIGQPRNDIFYIETENPIKNLVHNKKIILYLPTHRKEGKIDIDCEKIFNLKMVNEFCNNNNCVFVIKKHFYHRNDRKISNVYENIIDITGSNYDTQLLMKYSSLLITDYSSCYVDYLLLNRPIIFYKYDFEDYLMNDRDMYYNYDEITPGLKCSNFEDMMKEIKDYFENGIDNYVIERYNCLNMFYSKNAREETSPKIYNYIIDGFFDKRFIRGLK